MNDFKNMIEDEAEKRFNGSAHRSTFIEGATFGMGLKDEWISVDNEPEQHQLIAATNGRTVHVGTYYIETGKICLSDDLRFEEGGMYCSLQENYTLWLPLPSPPKTKDL